MADKTTSVVHGVSLGIRVDYFDNGDLQGAEAVLIVAGATPIPIGIQARTQFEVADRLARALFHADRSALTGRLP